jgi:hypothetical protein
VTVELTLVLGPSLVAQLRPKAAAAGMAVDRYVLELIYADTETQFLSPHHDALEFKAAQRREHLARLHGYGLTVPELAAALGSNPSSIYRDMQRLGLKANRKAA